MKINDKNKGKLILQFDDYLHRHYINLKLCYDSEIIHYFKA